MLILSICPASVDAILLQATFVINILNKILNEKPIVTSLGLEPRTPTLKV